MQLIDITTWIKITWKLTGKRVKNPKKSATIDNILLKGLVASFGHFTGFTIPLKESNKFKLHPTKIPFW